MNESVWSIFIQASLINNFVLAYFLGICPFIGVSGRYDTALRMGLAVTFVMMITAACAYFVHLLLTAIGAPYLELITFVVVIATSVQFVEMFIKKMSPALFRALGIYLPLITANCAILALALFQTQRQYNFVQCLFFAAGAGAGFTLALLLMAGVREKLALSETPDAAQSAAVTLLAAGVLSLAFMGFAGLS